MPYRREISRYGFFLWINPTKADTDCFLRNIALYMRGGTVGESHKIAQNGYSFEKMD